MKQSIGIFDSGLGGLTVLRVLAQKFPNESFCYLGDIARLPYGNKSPETIKKYGLQILRFLKERNVKAVVIACNSASTIFLDEHEWEGMPILNVIAPGCEAALSASEDKRIGVLGTAATVHSHAYKKTLLDSDDQASIIEKACPLLVPLVEEGLVNDAITQAVIERYVSEIKEAAIKTVILGCTHYPVLKEDFHAVLGRDVTLIESGEVLTQRLNELFDTKVITRSNGDREIKVCITDLTLSFELLAKNLMGEEPFELERVAL